MMQSHFACENCGGCGDLRDGWCFKCRIRTVGFAKGQLRNDLHPGHTLRESAQKIVEDGKAGGLEPVPYGDKYRHF